MHQDIGRIFGMGIARTQYISIPRDIVTDEHYPFNRKGEKAIVVRISGKRLIVELPKKTGENVEKKKR